MEYFPNLSYIYHQNQLNVGKYTVCPTDPMGMNLDDPFDDSDHFF